MYSSYMNGIVTRNKMEENKNFLRNTCIYGESFHLNCWGRFRETSSSSINWHRSKKSWREYQGLRQLSFKEPQLTLLVFVAWKFFPSSSFLITLICLWISPTRLKLFHYVSPSNFLLLICFVYIHTERFTTKKDPQFQYID